MLKIPEIPKNIEAEQAVLGSVLINDEVLDMISEILITEDFYRKSHRIIFETMISLHNERKSIDNITITDKLLKEKKLAQVGGIAFITSLANIVPTTVNVMDYAKIVKEKSVLRKVITAAENIISAPPGSLSTAKESAEYDRIIAARDACMGNRGKMAELLKIDRSTLWRKMKHYGIS